MKHLGPFLSGSSLLCKKSMLRLDSHRRETFRVCFPLGLPSPCVSGYVVGFESVFEHGCAQLRLFPCRKTELSPFSSQIFPGYDSAFCQFSATTP